MVLCRPGQEGAGERLRWSGVRASLLQQRRPSGQDKPFRWMVRKQPGPWDQGWGLSALGRLFARRARPEL
jgi:hypothetical protein